MECFYSHGTQLLTPFFSTYSPFLYLDPLLQKKQVLLKDAAPSPYLPGPPDNPSKSLPLRHTHVHKSARCYQYLEFIIILHRVSKTYSIAMTHACVKFIHGLDYPLAGLAIISCLLSRK